MSAPIRPATIEPAFRDDGSRRWSGALKQEVVSPETGLITSQTIAEAYPDIWLTGPKAVWCAAVIRRHGLLLELIDESEQLYRRVGLFVMSGNRWEMEPRFAQQQKVELEII